jgi:hypothetical protein
VTHLPDSCVVASLADDGHIDTQLKGSTCGANAEHAHIRIDKEWLAELMLQQLPALSECGPLRTQQAPYSPHSISETVAPGRSYFS